LSTSFSVERPEDHGEVAGIVVNRSLKKLVYDSLGATLLQIQQDIGDAPSVLDWNCGLDLVNLLPEQMVFSPPLTGEKLPYLDRTVDVVVVGEINGHKLLECNRVARIAVVFHCADTIDLSWMDEGANTSRIGPFFVSWKSGVMRDPWPSVSVVI